MNWDKQVIREALAHIPAHDRDLWVKMGMAVKSEFGEDGFDIWKQWSMSDESYNENDAAAVWRSIANDGAISIGSLIFEAEQHGWSRSPDAPANAIREDKASQGSDRSGQIGEQLEKRKRAKETARTLLSKAELLKPDHPYIKKKGIRPTDTLYELHVSDLQRLIGYSPLSGGIPLKGRIIIAPVYLDDDLSTVEFIDEVGKKSALSGGAKSGGYWPCLWPLSGDASRSTLLVGEGVATVISAVEATNHLGFAALSAGNLAKVAKTLRERFPEAEIVILGELEKGSERTDPAGLAAAISVQGRVAFPEFQESETGNVTDFNDLHANQGLDAVRTCVERAKGTRSNGEQLLDDLRDFIGTFCVFPNEACLDVVTLWAVHAHFIPGFYTTPRLALLSPEPGSGKSRVLEILGTITPDAMHMISPSVAALFRKLAVGQVTLLFDECDAIFQHRGKENQNEDLRALINGGYRQGATIPRCVGTKHEVQDFPIFAATGLAGLGNLPETIMTRSIVIKMRRRLASESVAPYRAREHEALGFELRDRIGEWAEPIKDDVVNSRPVLPEGITDRLADVWEPIIAVADAAGGHWPETARNACRELAGASRTNNESLGVRLLRDLKDVFETDQALPTETILNRLNGIEPIGLDPDGDEIYVAADAPWSNLRGEPLDARRLANFLKHFEIKSKKIRFEGGPLQGYSKADFADAWGRYVSPGPENAEPPEPVEPRALKRPINLPKTVASSSGSVGSGLAPLRDEQQPEV